MLVLIKIAVAERNLQELSGLRNRPTRTAREAWGNKVSGRCA